LGGGSESAQQKGGVYPALKKQQELFCGKITKNRKKRAAGDHYRKSKERGTLDQGRQGEWKRGGGRSIEIINTDL